METWTSQHIRISWPCTAINILELSFSQKLQNVLLHMNNVEADCYQWLHVSKSVSSRAYLDQAVMFLHLPCCPIQYRTALQLFVGKNVTYPSQVSLCVQPARPVKDMAGNTAHQEQRVHLCRHASLAVET